MAILFVIGLMNLAWMVGIAVVLLAEKNWALASASPEPSAWRSPGLVGPSWCIRRS
jgi:predicted metal-binding membrane protein